MLQVGVSHRDLIDVEQKRIRWGTQLTAGAADVVAFATSLARQVATRIGKKPTKLYDFVLNLRTPAMAGDHLWGEALGALRREDVSAYLPATEQLILKYPSNVDALALRACALFYSRGLAGHRDSLEQVMTALEEIDPREPTPDCIRLTLLYDENRDEEFQEIAKRILERTDLTPAARAWPLRDRAWAWMKQGNIESAIADAQEALRLDPANYFNPYVLAVIYRKIQDNAKALIYAKQSVALNPCFQSYGLTSRILTDMERQDESFEYAIKACEIGNRANFCSRLAFQLLDADQETEAHRIAGKIATMPESGASAYNLACFYALTGDRTNAIQQLRSSLKLGSVPQEVYEDDDLLPLHGDAEFEALVAEVRKRAEQD